MKTRVRIHRPPTLALDRPDGRRFRGAQCWRLHPDGSALARVHVEAHLVADVAIPAGVAPATLAPGDPLCLELDAGDAVIGVHATGFADRAAAPSNQDPATNGGQFWPGCVPSRLGGAA